MTSRESAVRVEARWRAAARCEAHAWADWRRRRPAVTWNEYGQPDVSAPAVRAHAPRLAVYVGDWRDPGTFARLVVATTRRDWLNAAGARGRRRRPTPDRAAFELRLLAAWFALRRTGRARVTQREFLDDPEVGPLYVADMDDPSPAVDGGGYDDVLRDAAGHDLAVVLEQAVAAALLPDIDDGAEDARARRREHEHTDWRAPPPALEVLTECVLTAAPPLPRAYEATAARH